MGLAKRTVTSSAYSIAANVVEVVFLIGRAIALTKLLEPEVFGTFTYALSIVVLSLTLPNFGLGSALVHNAAETQGEKAVEVHFTLTVLFVTIWAIVVAAGVALFVEEGQRWVFWVIIGTEFASQLTQTPRALLTRQVMFGRLALYRAISAIASTLVAVWLAWNGFGMWSLLAINIVWVAVAAIMFWGIRPGWRPRLGWSRPTARYFLAFGSKVTAGNLLLETLDRVDDIWTGAVLGATALGFYNRAYRLATYPRGLLSAALTDVALGTYAQLDGDRVRLSQYFSMVIALIVRFNFLLAGGIGLVAPELISIVLGEQWLPMLAAFRLMLVYTLLDPIKLAVANVITMSGAPVRVVRTRLIQLAVLLAGLFVLGRWRGIAGVAVAVDLMLIVGLALLFRQARAYVDFSIATCFCIPGLALLVAMPAGQVLGNLHGIAGSDWRTASVKLGAFVVAYSGVVVLAERRRIPLFLELLRRLRPGSRQQ